MAQVNVPVNGGNNSVNIPQVLTPRVGTCPVKLLRLSPPPDPIQAPVH